MTGSVLALSFRGQSSIQPHGRPDHGSRESPKSIPLMGADRPPRQFRPSCGYQSRLGPPPPRNDEGDSQAAVTLAPLLSASPAIKLRALRRWPLSRLASCN